MVRVFNSIALYRNVSDYPYPIALTEERSNEAFGYFISLFNDIGLIKERGLLRFDALISDAVRQEMGVKFGVHDVKNIRSIKSGIIFDASRCNFIAINRGEHISIMSTDVASPLSNIYESVSRMDDAVEKASTYAFSEKYGYLMSDISYLGTGLVASSVLSLPCLHELSYIDKIAMASSQIGIVIENAFPAVKNNSFYRVYNKNTLGMSEREIIESVDNVCAEIVKKEIDARETLIISKRLEMEDRIMKSYGRMRYSRLLSNEEMLESIAMVKLGVYFRIIEDVQSETMDHLIHKQIELQSEDADMRLVGGMRFEEARSRMLRNIFEE